MELSDSVFDEISGSIQREKEDITALEQELDELSRNPVSVDRDITHAAALAVVTQICGELDECRSIRKVTNGTIRFSEIFNLEEDLKRRFQNLGLRFEKNLSSGGVYKIFLHEVSLSHDRDRSLDPKNILLAFVEGNLPDFMTILFHELTHTIQYSHIGAIRRFLNKYCSFLLPASPISEGILAEFQAYGHCAVLESGDLEEIRAEAPKSFRYLEKCKEVEPAFRAVSRLILLDRFTIAEIAAMLHGAKYNKQTDSFDHLERIVDAALHDLGVSPERKSDFFELQKELLRLKAQLSKLKIEIQTRKALSEEKLKLADQRERTRQNLSEEEIAFAADPRLAQFKAQYETLCVGDSQNLLWEQVVGSLDISIEELIQRTSALENARVLWIDEENNLVFGDGCDSVPSDTLDKSFVECQSEAKQKGLCLLNQKEWGKTCRRDLPHGINKKWSWLEDMYDPNVSLLGIPGGLGPDKHPGYSLPHVGAWRLLKIKLKRSI